MSGRQRAILQVCGGLAGAAGIAATALALGLAGQASAATSILGLTDNKEYSGTDPVRQLADCPLNLESVRPQPISDPPSFHPVKPLTLLEGDSLRVFAAIRLCGVWNGMGNPTSSDMAYAPAKGAVIWKDPGEALIEGTVGNKTGNWETCKSDNLAVGCPQDHVTGTLEIEDATVADTGQYYFGMPEFVGPPTSEPFFNHDRAGGIEGAASILVLKPQLALIKEVCSTGTDCDADAGEGEGGWVKHQLVAAGSTVQWRITARNTGNVKLNDLTLAGDTIDPPLAADCLDQKFDSSSIAGGETYDEGSDTFTDGGVAHLVCETTVPDDIQDGTYENTAWATATFEGDGPDKNPLIERFTDGVVPSKEDSASIATLRPAISLIKEVCDTTAGSCDPNAPLGEDGWADANDPDTKVTVPAGTKATWRLTVTNEGSAYLEDVKVSFDALTGGANQDDPEFAGCLGKLFTTGTELLAPASSTSVVCSGPDVISPFLPLINTARAAGTATDENGTVLPPFTDPGTDTPGTTVTSDPDPAHIIAEPDPGLAVKKYVCIAAKASDCDKPPADLTTIDPAVWADAGAAPSSPATDDETSTDRAWVKDGDTATWLIVASNTGNVPLTDVHLATDQLSGMTDGVTQNSCTAETRFPLAGTPGLLWPKVEDPTADPPIEQPAGKPYATAITCQTGPIKATNPPKNTINAATATGTPTDEHGDPYPPGDVPEPTSNTDIAKVVAGDPSLALKKYACKNPATKTGTGCETPASISGTPEEQKAALEAAGWMDADDEASHVFVEDGQPVQWLIVARNTGNVPLADVSVSEDTITSGPDESSARFAGCEGKMDLLDESATQLAPGAFAILTCQTERVDATIPASEVVNSATATGKPANPDSGEPLGWDDEVSDPDEAHVQAAAPAITLTKWVCDAGKACALADFVSETRPGTWVKATQIPAGTNATWLIAVTNSGTVNLKDVTLATDTLTAAGRPARATDGADCIAGAPSISLAVGETKPLTTCTSNGVLLAESPLINTATAKGTSDDEFETAVTSPPDSAQVTVPTPTPVTPPSGKETTPSASPTTPPGGSTTPPGGSTTPPAGGPLPPGGPSTGGDGKLPNPPGPALRIVKQVCQWGTGCDVNTDSDWVAQTTQPAGKAATWRIVVANIGTQPLTDIKVSDALSVTRSGPEASCQMASGTADVLQPGYQVKYLCASAPVAKSDSGLVNTASATAKSKTTGALVSTTKTSAKVLVEGARGTLPYTGVASLGMAGLALMLIAAGSLGLCVRQRRLGRPRHAA